MKACAHCLDRNRIVYGPDTESGRESLPCYHPSELEAIVPVGGFLVRLLREVETPGVRRELAGAAIVVGFGIILVMVLGIIQTVG